MTTIELLKSALHNKIWRRNVALPLLEEIKQAGRINDIVALLGSVFLKKEEETVRRFVADVFAGEILEIADNANDNDAEKEAREDIARSKLRIDTRKWLMAHFAPAQYGDGAANDKGKRSFPVPRLYLPENGRD
ncbi:hypothetical protein J0X12_13135 [Sneathiella sp. CAU 1612]|jgi:hypothetical protein|uniref:Uncharacterized protein n=1 Tax=Sneathiella sedimenti TaxID=2816034 RepID=A0ABS3F7R5_9PROT|nr:hypothetical protein [Sneathiella sedimenti]MBO0334566.1 hypothetical protein [Sneathiella sedimenti]